MMKKTMRRALSTACAAVGVSLVVQLGAVAAPTAAPVVVPVVAPVVAPATTAADNLSPAERIRQLLPLSHLTTAQQRVLSRMADHLPTPLTSAGQDSIWAASVRRAINPEDYECAPGHLEAWLINELEEIDPVTLFLVILLGGAVLPTYDALLFGQESRSNEFGVDGEDTNELNRTMRDLRRFWDIDGSDIELIPMHGAATFRDVGHLRDLLLTIGFPADLAAEAATALRDLVNSDPALEGGDHPIFTFNAFAFTAEGDPDPAVQGLSDRIIMGDGVLEGLAALGLSATAPRSVLAHEYGHQVQFATHLIPATPATPESTRRVELMADAFSGYFMTHKKGQAANKFAVMQEQEVAFALGDCLFDVPGHHGTPNQRRAATEWAADLAAAMKPRSAILPSRTFAATFDAQLPVIVAPDAP